MHRTEHVEVLYLDFDGFFASAEQADPRLRRKPVGIVPFNAAPTKSMTVIAVSKEAKKLGVKNVMRVRDVLAICRQIVLGPQRPDLIRRAHLTLLSEIEAEIPIDVVKSIYALACTLDQNTSANPRGITSGDSGSFSVFKKSIGSIKWACALSAISLDYGVHLVRVIPYRGKANEALRRTSADPFLQQCSGQRQTAYRSKAQAARNASLALGPSTASQNKNIRMLYCLLKSDAIVAACQTRGRRRATSTPVQDQRQSTPI